MTTLTQDVEEIVKRAALGDVVGACAYRTLVTDEGEHIVDVVLVIDTDEWDEAAVATCELASEKLADAARDTPHALGFFCRTPREHRDSAELEAGLWTPIEVGVAC